MLRPPAVLTRVMEKVRMIELDILKKPVLLDGGMGRELRFRGVETPGTIWSALALITHPEVIRQIHVDYIHAGADIITSNSYGIVRGALALENMEDRFAELNRTAGRLASQSQSRNPLEESELTVR